ncbi:MAG: GIY-YIG nuclease family protein [Desulfobacterales bacterium]|nr:GIY-YIG nuclease family protein [Desulfobacterales bacterium]
MSGQYYVYIMTNEHDKVLYTGMTNNLKRRAYEHKEKMINGFTKKYNITKKIDLVNSINRKWLNLYEEL